MDNVKDIFDKKVSIIMPAYNEEPNVGDTVSKCLSVLEKLRIDGEVVITNDGSSDRTGVILEELKKRSNNIVVVHHNANKGYGASLWDAFAASKGEVIVTIDSDGQFDINELPALLGLYKKGNMVVTGFRKGKRDSFLRVIADRILNFLVNVMFGLWLKDSNCAFKVYDRQALKGFSIESMGFSAPTEILVKLKTLGFSISEIGITHSVREKGKSSLKLVKTAVNFLIFLIYLKLKQFLYKARVISSI